MTTLFAARKVGAHYATRVRVAAPQGSAFNGRTGLVSRVEGRTVVVRFPAGQELAFAISELEVLS